MELESSFSVVAPIDTVWQTLMDFERIAASVPGAELLNQLSDDTFQVGMKVRLGPVSLQYKGQVTVVEQDDASHTASFQGRAQETRGQGTAEGSATLVLTETDGTTTGSVKAELALSGRAAAMGKSIINSVTQQMMSLFAKNLQEMVAGETDDAEPGLGSDASTAADTDSAETQPGDPQSGESQAAKPGAPASSAVPNRPVDNSLDAMTFVKGIVTDQLNNPAKLLGLVFVVAVIAFLIGRRSGGRA